VLALRLHHRQAGIVRVRRVQALALRLLRRQV